MRFLAISFLAAAFLVGCGERRDMTAYAVIDGKVLTAHYVKDVVRINAKILELAKRPIKDGEFSKWASAEAQRIFDSLVNAELLEREIVAKGEEPEAEDFAKTLEQYNLATGQQAKNVDELAVLFGKLEKPFREQYLRSARFIAYERRHWRLPPTAAEVADYFQQASNMCAQAAKISKDARNNAESAWQRLEAGVAWDIVAADCSEDRLVKPEYAAYSKEWMVVGKDGFGYPELAAALPNLKVGGYSRPLDTMEGLLIVKLLEKSESSYRLARILFRMGNEFQLPSVAEAKALLTEQKLQMARVNFMSAKRSTSKLEFPRGWTINCEMTKEED